MKGYLIDENRFIIPQYIEADDKDTPSNFISFETELKGLDTDRYKVLDDKGVVLMRFEPNQEMLDEIEGLKAALVHDDYKITKCYEAQLLGRDMPYDVATLVEGRQKMRVRINDLEKLI